MPEFIFIFSKDVSGRIILEHFHVTIIPMTIMLEFSRPHTEVLFILSASLLFSTVKSQESQGLERTLSYF